MKNEDINAAHPADRPNQRRESREINPNTVYIIAAVSGLAMLSTGCTYHASRLAKTGARLASESKALTTAVVDVLNAQPAPARDAYTATALDFARQDQRIEGLPTQPFDVPALLAGFGLTNHTTHPGATQPTPRAIAEARRETVSRFAAQNQLIATRAAAEDHLQQLGAAAEIERNARVTRWTKFTGWTLGLAGAAAALLIFCPLALPIAGRLLAWLVSKIPSFASALGVVSVRAFDAIVLAIEKSRTPANATIPNTSEFGVRASAPPGWLANLENTLSREMDAAHKALVRSRKQTLNH